MRAKLKSEAGHGLVVGLAALALCFLLWHAGSVQATPSSAEPFGADTVIYTVQPGDTLRSIAAEYGVTIGAIVRANRLSTPDMIYPGQRLTIPVVVSATDTPVAPATVTDTPVSVPATASPLPPASPTAPPAALEVAAEAIYHTVELGDTLAAIAANYGVSVETIIEINKIDDPDLIWVGQQLQVTEATQTDALITTPTALPGVTATRAPLSTEQPPSAAQASAQPTPSSALPKPTVYTVQPGDTIGSIAEQFGVTVSSLVEMNDLPNADILGIGQELIIPFPGSVTANIRPTEMRVDISEQRCYIYQEEILVAKWVCSTGRPGTTTRPGSYKIQSKLPKAYGSTWDIWMPYWLGIYWAGASENGIHGLPWDAETGAQIWRGSVGAPITFGCVMLDNVNAKMLYDMAYIGMPVIINP